MKRIIFLVLLSTMLFSAQKQIIVGNFSNETNAYYDLQRLYNYMEADSELVALAQENKLELQVKTIGNYSTIVIFPFEGETELLKAKRILGKYYFDLYSIDFIPTVEAKGSM